MAKSSALLITTRHPIAAAVAAVAAAALCQRRLQVDAKSLKLSTRDPTLKHARTHTNTRILEPKPLRAHYCRVALSTARARTRRRVSKRLALVRCPVTTGVWYDKAPGTLYASTEYESGGDLHFAENASIT